MYRKLSVNAAKSYEPLWKSKAVRFWDFRISGFLLDILRLEDPPKNTDPKLETNGFGMWSPKLPAYLLEVSNPSNLEKKIVIFSPCCFFEWGYEPWWIRNLSKRTLPTGISPITWKACVIRVTKMKLLSTPEKADNPFTISQQGWLRLSIQSPLLLVGNWYIYIYIYIYIVRVRRAKDSKVLRILLANIKDFPPSLQRRFIFFQVETIIVYPTWVHQSFSQNGRIPPGLPHQTIEVFFNQNMKIVPPRKRPRALALPPCRKPGKTHEISMTVGQQRHVDLDRKNSSQIKV